MPYRIVRDDGVVLVKELSNIFDAGRIAKDLADHDTRKHEYFVRLDNGELVKLRAK